jgi:hypothetical protein
MKYETPICEILKFSEDDIIRTSDGYLDLLPLVDDPTNIGA